MKPALALDMDGVLADWDRGLAIAIRLDRPDMPLIPYEDRRNFHASDDYPEEEREYIKSVSRRPGFYFNLPPVPGALESVRELEAEGRFDLIILTAPMSHHPTCAQEKVAWVQEYLGQEWVSRMTITRDKTRVRATYLIDDRPGVDGVLTPEWEHLLFTRPYNLQVKGKCRITWDTWRDVLKSHRGTDTSPRTRW